MFFNLRMYNVSHFQQASYEKRERFTFVMVGGFARLFCPTILIFTASKIWIK